MNFGQIMVGIALAGEALGAEQQFKAALADSTLTPSEVSSICDPIIQSVSALVKHSLPAELVNDIEKAVADAVNNYHFKQHQKI